MNPIAIIRIRGTVNVRKEIQDTLYLLRLRKKHTCVVLHPNNSLKGMIEKVKDFITWGEIDKETFRELLLKRGKLVGNIPFTEEYLKKKTGMSLDEFIEKFFEGKISLKDIPGFKPFFRLNSPRRGFERGGIKKPFHLGGALGYRGKYINDLIKRML